MASRGEESNSGPYTDKFERVLRAEYDAILDRRRALGVDASKDTGGKPDSVAKGDPAWLFGVALSGGGIRSASLCLGALQALDQYKLIPRIDYLSTVSGGGYIGSAMIADMTRQELAPAKSGKRKRPDFPFASGDDVRDNALVGHIRDNSRFLAPRGFQDITLSIGILMRGWMVNVLLLLTLILPLATFVILTNPTTDHLGHSIVLDVANWLFGDDWGKAGWAASLRSLVANPFVLSRSMMVVLAVWLVVWGLRRSYTDSYAFARKGERLEQDSNWAKGGRTLLLVTAGLLLIEIQPKIILWLIEVTSPKAGHRQTTMETLKALITAAGAIVTATAAFRGILISWLQKALNSPGIGHQLRGYLARAAFLALGLALPLLIYGFFLLITIWGIKIFSPITIWGFDVSWLFGRDSGYAYGPAWLTADNRVLFTILVISMALFLAARTFVVRYLADDLAPGRLSGFFGAMRHDYSGSVVIKVLLLIACSAIFAVAARMAKGVWQHDESTVLLNYLAISAIVTMVAFNFTENANGLHRLYRDRLRQAFRLGGSEDQADIALDALGAMAPYLLINGTLNVRRARDAGQTADPPKRSVLVRAIRWVGAKVAAAIRLRAWWGGPDIILPGHHRPIAPPPAVQVHSLPEADPSKRGRNAEFFLFSKHFVGSTSTGYASSTAMAKAEGQLDLAAAAAISGAAISSSMGRTSLGLLGPTLALLNLRLGFWLPNPSGIALGKRPPRRSWEDILRLYLLAEATGQLRSDSSRVYITDGGHIDNIGLYQLLKRRCKLIIVVDAEADAGMNFGAFTDVQRFARIDLGVRISLDWRPVRDAALARDANRTKIVPPESDLHLRHFAVGKILYENDPVEGILVYVKASVTGDEPDYVLDYERRYPLFPHESTSDQFFSEEQMEAYRALGFHAMRVALRERPHTAEIKAEDSAQASLVALLKMRLGNQGQEIR